MGIRIDGASDLINATDGSLTIEGQSVNTTGTMSRRLLRQLWVDGYILETRIIKMKKDTIFMGDEVMI